MVLRLASSASPTHLLEMQNLMSDTDLLTQNVHFNKICYGLVYTLKFENDGAGKLFISLHTQAEFLLGPSTTTSGVTLMVTFMYKKRFSRVKKKKKG